MIVKKIFERIIDYAYFGDTDRQSYHGVQKKIERSNTMTALIFASVATVLILVMLLLSYSQEGFAGSRIVYILGIILSAAQVGIALLARKVWWLSYVSVYLAISVFLAYGIAIGTLTRPEEQTVTFMVMLIFVPLIFVDRPIRMAAALTLYIIVFIIMCMQTKSNPVLGVDITDAVIFGLLSIISESVVYRAKIRSYVLENRLKLMSETDQLTGLNNRNCYEMRLSLYPSVYKKSLCCIYIDVNGLHDLNNSKGHNAGDEMLRFIADSVIRQFGCKDSYRIGGDEFVSFAADITLEEVQNRISALNAQITDRGYHAAVGYEFTDSPDVNMNELIVKAETKMYSDKSAYYKQHDRRSRSQI